MCPRCGERVLLPSADDDEVVDLPSTPPEEIASVPVECKLCSSRYYALPRQIGQSLACPDCHTENIVPAPKAKKSLMEALHDDEDFKLSEPVDTPRYQALSRDALDFERAIHSQHGLQPEQDLPTGPPPKPAKETAGDDFRLEEPSPRPSVSVSSSPKLPAPATVPASPDDIDLFPEDRAPPPPRPRPAEPAVRLDEQDDAYDPSHTHDDVVLSAPVERVEHRPVVQLPKPNPPEYSDDGSDFAASIQSMLPKGKDAIAPLPEQLARRKPFSGEAFRFLFQPAIFGRWIVLSLLIMVELWAIDMMLSAMAVGGYAIVGGFLIYLAAFLPGLGALLSLSMFCFTIVQDTANGEEHVVSWSELSWFSWIESTVFFAAAFFVAGLPGALLAAGFLSLGAHPTMTPFLLLPSLVLLFPPVLISMLEAGSVMEPFSMAMLRGYVPLFRFWRTFYLLSLALGLLGLVVVNTHFGDFNAWRTLTLAPTAILCTALPLVYFRLLGRMAMMYRDYMHSIAPDEEDDRPAATKRYVVQ